jgi:hypothetical protein
MLTLSITRWSIGNGRRCESQLAANAAMYWAFSDAGMSGTSRDK